MVNGAKIYVALKKVGNVLPQAKPPQVNRKNESDTVMGPLLKVQVTFDSLYLSFFFSSYRIIRKFTNK